MRRRGIKEWKSIPPREKPATNKKENISRTNRTVNTTRYITPNLIIHTLYIDPEVVKTDSIVLLSRS